MNKTAPAIFALLIAATGSFAQEPRPDSLEVMRTIIEGNLNASSIPSSAIAVSADPVELTGVDVVAGNLRFLFNPTHAFDFWPEYLYEYNAVRESKLCREEGSETRNHELGTIAVVSHQASERQYTGIALFPTDYASLKPEVIPSLQVEDLCGWLARNNNDLATGDNGNPPFFATSRAIPVEDLDFSRVDLNLGIEQ